MAKDFFHEHVKEALRKDGWNITHDPYVLRADEIDYDVDLGAEKLIAATRDSQKILVEVKSFLRQSRAYEMHHALGQFNTYVLALQEQEPDRKLFLAVPRSIYEEFFRKAFIQKLIQHYAVHLVVFDPGQKIIVKWMP